MLKGITNHHLLYQFTNLQLIDQLLILQISFISKLLKMSLIDKMMLMIGQNTLSKLVNKLVHQMAMMTNLVNQFAYQIGHHFPILTTINNVQKNVYHELIRPPNSEVIRPFPVPKFIERVFRPTNFRNFVEYHSVGNRIQKFLIQ